MVDYQDLLAAAAFVTTVVLTALSLTAYTGTRERRLIIITGAFAIWSIRLGITAIGALFIPAWEDASWVETTTSVLDAIAPILIFYGVVKGEAVADAD